MSTTYVDSLVNITLNVIYNLYLPCNDNNYKKLKQIFFSNIPIDILEKLAKYKFGNLLFMYLRYIPIEPEFICRMLELNAPIGDQWSKLRIYYLFKQANNIKYNNTLEILTPYKNYAVDCKYKQYIGYPSITEETIDKTLENIYIYNNINSNAYSKLLHNYFTRFEYHLMQFNLNINTISSISPMSQPLETLINIGNIELFDTTYKSNNTLLRYINIIDFTNNLNISFVKYLLSLSDSLKLISLKNKILNHIKSSINEQYKICIPPELVLNELKHILLNTN